MLSPIHLRNIEIQSQGKASFPEVRVHMHPSIVSSKVSTQVFPENVPAVGEILREFLTLQVYYMFPGKSQVVFTSLIPTYRLIGTCNNVYN
jgi:hypothetical protein